MARKHRGGGAGAPDRDEAAAQSSTQTLLQRPSLVSRDEFVRRLIARGVTPPAHGARVDRFTLGSEEILVPLVEQLDGRWCDAQLARLPAPPVLASHPAVIEVPREGDWTWDAFVRALVALGLEAPTGSKPFNEYRRGELRIVVPFGEYLDGRWCSEQLARCAVDTTAR